MALSRKAFHFDLDVNKLKALYPSDKENGWKRAWTDIGKFMERHGFEHAQYSGYESIKPMSYDKAYEIMRSMSEAFPWFCSCAQAASMTEVGQRHDAQLLEPLGGLGAYPFQVAHRRVRREGDAGFGRHGVSAPFLDAI